MHGPLLKAGGDSAVLFQAAHQPLDSIPLTIARGIEAVPTVQGALIAPARDHRADAPSGQCSPYARVAVAPVAHYEGGSVPRTARTGTPHAPAVQERLQVERFVPFAPGEEERHRFAAALRAQVDLGGEATALASEHLMLLATHGSRGVLVRTDNRTVHVVRIPVEPSPCISGSLKFLQYPLPYSDVGPPPEPAPYGGPRPESLRQIPPRRTGPQHP